MAQHSFFSTCVYKPARFLLHVNRPVFHKYELQYVAWQWYQHIFPMPRIKSKTLYSRFSRIINPQAVLCSFVRTQTPGNQKEYYDMSDDHNYTDCLLFRKIFTNYDLTRHYIFLRCTSSKELIVTCSYVMVSELFGYIYIYIYKRNY